MNRVKRDTSPKRSAKRFSRQANHRVVRAPGPPPVGVPVRGSNPLPETDAESDPKLWPMYPEAQEGDAPEVAQLFEEIVPVEASILVMRKELAELEESASSSRLAAGELRDEMRRAADEAEAQEAGSHGLPADQADARSVADAAPVEPATDNPLADLSIPELGRMASGNDRAQAARAKSELVRRAVEGV